jgi:hypothetical protein
LLVIAFFASANIWAAASERYHAGISAFKASDYSQALEHFAAARRAGMTSPTLHYNLGATHYKLGHYRLAAAEFSRIGEDPKWGALAQYNLGLIAAKMGEPDEAQRHFRIARREATSAKLTSMADAKLAPSSPSLHASTLHPSTGAAEPAWMSYLSLGTGYDDNVILADDSTLAAVSGEDDYFVELAAYTSGYVAGDFADGWRLDLGGNYRGHSDLDDFDFGTGSVAAMYNRLVGSWHVQAGARGALQLAGGDHYTTGATIRARAYRRFGDVGLRLTNDLALIEGASNFDYLSGTQNRLTVEFIRQMTQARVRGGYQFELNDRDDLTLTNEFFSYSPTRHGIFGAVEMPFSERLVGEARADFQTSDYADDNVEIELDDSVTQAARDADRLSATLRLAFQLSRKWQVFGEYQYSDNSSNIDRYSYNSSRYKLGIESTR